MSHIAEITVRSPDLALAPTLAAISDIDIRVDPQPVTPSDSPTLFYSVQTTAFERFESALATDDTVQKWSVDAAFDESRLYRITLSPETRILTPTLLEFGLRILSATGIDGGWQLRLHTAERDAIEQFLDFCRDCEIECGLTKIFSTDGESRVTTENAVELQLTDRQREVARTAVEMGYFETGGASAAEVAEALDITPSTLSSHLRAVTATVFERLFGD